jgi:hypothetical protein
MFPDGRGTLRDVPNPELDPARPAWLDPNEGCLTLPSEGRGTFRLFAICAGSLCVLNDEPPAEGGRGTL